MNSQNLQLAAREAGKKTAEAVFEERENLRESLLRDSQYPWRRNPSPYEVLLAEFLLRKTTARQAESVFLELLKQHPGPCSFARASVEDLAAFLQPLGLRGRAMLLVDAMREICERYSGEVPCEREALEEIKGLGPYMAGAVLSFGCKKREPIVDTGIARLWNRVTGGAVTKRYSPHRDPAAWEASFAYIQAYPGPPDEGNYILLDLARLLCTPKAPACAECPLKTVCAAGRSAPDQFSR